MVKSKNKKSVIALVVMAFLLVASIVLAATGAWFTATDSKSSNGANLKFGNLSVSGSVTKMQVCVNGSWEDADAAEIIVMPGDKVRGGVYSFEITTNDTAGAYYLLKSGDKYYTVGAAGLEEYTTGALTAVTSGAKLTFGGVGDEGAYVGGAEGSTIANEKQDTSASVSAGSYTIYVIQASNIAAAEAGTTIKGLVEAATGFPSNKA